MRTIEEAKNNAAEFVLMQLYPMNNSEVSTEMIYMPKEPTLGMPSYQGQHNLYQTNSSNQITINNQVLPSNTPTNLVQTVVVQNDPNLFLQQPNNSSTANRPVNHIPEFQIQTIMAPQYILDNNGI